MTLSKNALLSRILDACTASGYQTLITDQQHPFGIRIFKNDETAPFLIRAYIWNCTHGGKNRADDEYRVQLTGVVPEMAPGEKTLLLGWHEDHNVFVGFDIAKHAGQDSASPSIQVKENVLADAHLKAFSAYERANGEIAIAFRPEFFVDYARQASRLHGQKGKIGEYLEALNNVAALTEEDVASIPPERAEILTTIRKKVRAQDFRKRVLSAYENRCAMCGVQLRLIEAAHILPVAAPESTDETRNGIALCSLHHTAYDRNLVSFAEDYRIEVSHAESVELRNAGFAEGIETFQAALQPKIILPASASNYPHVHYVRRSREIRRWRA